MSVASDRISQPKLTKSSTELREQMLHILLKNYAKKIYGDIATDRDAQIDRQLLRYEYYNDIIECVLNYCQLKKQINYQLNIFDRIVVTKQKKVWKESQNREKCDAVTFNLIENRIERKEKEKEEVYYVEDDDEEKEEENSR